VAPITSTALASAPARLAGIASGVNNTVSRVGGLLAVGLIGLVISLVYSSRAPGSDLRPLAERPTTAVSHDASVDAFRAGLVLSAGLALAGGLIAAIRISNEEALVREETEASPAASAE
jgi:hypothetical protein